MRSQTMKKALGALAIALVGGTLGIAPADADHGEPGDHIYGHRCRMYDRAVSNENTPVALADTAGVPGAICEIDAVKIADGTVIAWHDVDWRRVADPNTLPAGVAPQDRVVNATWAQVSQIRTRGGQPVARLEDMIDAAAQHDIPLAVDLRSALPNPAALVGYATAAGAEVSWYQLLPSNCNTRLIDGFRAAGAQVGVKILNACTTITPTRLAELGISYTQQLSSSLSSRYLREMNRRNISVGVLNGGMTEDVAEELIDQGVSRVLLDRPREALGWFS
jgi:hypothetical protein